MMPSEAGRIPIGCILELLFQAKQWDWVDQLEQKLVSLEKVRSLLQRFFVE